MLDETRECVFEIARKKIENFMLGKSRIGPELNELDSDDYRSGDEARLVQSLNSGFDPEDSECLLKRRNRGWIYDIDRYHEAFAPAFFAVGAGHLVGEESVIELLLQRGYKVRRIGQQP